MTASDFVSRLGEKAKAKPTGSGWMCICPAHADSNQSLSVSPADNGGTLIYCHHGCKAPDICAAVGLKVSDLMPDKPAGRGNGSFNIVKEYPYRDEAGALLFMVCRMDPKDFRQCVPDPASNGGRRWSIKGVRQIPYRLPELVTAVTGRLQVFVCEGEKDCDSLFAAGLIATCNAGGAGKWKPQFAEFFRKSTVCVIADKDGPGRKHAQEVAANLFPVADRVAVIELPDLNLEKVKDASDFLAAGGTAADILRAAQDAPSWTPPALPVHAAAAEPGDGESAEDGLDHHDDAAIVRGAIIAILMDKLLSKPEKHRRVAIAVVNALAERGRFFFHADRRDFDSAMFFHNRRKRLERVVSDSFIAWLSDWVAINRSDSMFSYIASGIQTAALASAHTTAILPEAYWASRPGAIYLSNGDGHAVKLSAAGVDLVDNGSDGVLFAAGRTLAPWRLTDPVDPFTTCSLFQHLHSESHHALDLMRLWLYSLPSNPRSKPPLVLTGEIGSGKTREAKGFAEFYGLPFVAQKVEEQKEADFWPCIDSGGIFCMDNADTRCRWLPDAVASASTDGSSQRRKLYTDSETVMLRPRAWLVITAANPTFASDAGLSDRLLLVRMMRREDQDTSDSSLSDEIAAARDAGLSHVATTLAHAISDESPVPGGLNKRHPDFAAFAVRIGRALGRESETIAALQAAEMDKSDFCLENDTLGAALLAHFSNGATFDGSASDLKTVLTSVDPKIGEWSAKSMGKRLSSIWPHLSKVLDAKRNEVQHSWFFQISRKGHTPQGALGL